MLLKLPNGQLLVAVEHSQLRTMASEAVEPVDWPFAPRFPLTEPQIPLSCHSLSVTRNTPPPGTSRARDTYEVPVQCFSTKNELK